MAQGLLYLYLLMLEGTILINIILYIYIYLCIYIILSNVYVTL